MKSSSNCDFCSLKFTIIFSYLMIILLFFQFIILAVQYGFTNSLVGENIRSAVRGEFNFVVSIMLRNTRNPHPQRDHGCTGSLVSNRDVLTVDHCVRNKDWDELQIIVGSIDLWRGTKFFPCWWITYNKWVSLKRLQLEYKSNDIAIIRLTETVDRLNITPVALSSVYTPAFYHSNVTIVGWGVSNTGSTASILQVAQVKVLTNEECTHRVSFLERRDITFQERLLCTAGEPFVLMHRGDSGGPLLFMNTIIAVNKGNCPLAQTVIHPAKVNLHFGIDYYRNYILDVINNF